MSNLRTKYLSTFVLSFICIYLLFAVISDRFDLNVTYVFYLAFNMLASLNICFFVVILDKLEEIKNK